MKTLITTLWIFIFSFLYSNDTTISQKDESIKEDSIIHVIPETKSISEIQLKAFNSRMKLLYCDILITKNKQSIQEIKSINTRKYSPGYIIKKDSLVEEIKVINKNN